MAQAFQRFGSKVILLEKTGQILPREEIEASERLKKVFLSDGIDLRLSAEIAEVLFRDGKKLIHYIVDGEKNVLEVDSILIGVGRAPNVEKLGLEVAGVAFDEKDGIRVSDRLQTTNPRIYAAGDICSRYKFTHAADAMARIVIRNALFSGRAKVSTLTIPWSTYTEPEIAHVGMSVAELKKENVQVDTYVQEMNEVDRAILDGEDEGYVKIYARKGTDKILGATVVASHAGDLISEITLAMVGGLGLKTISGTIHPYPTQGEAIKKVGDAYFRSRMSPLVSKLFSFWFKLRR
jgi:pyruvate/2-oxoglutarate dehydrogenase complex dihydrolipoamide dehydrogenase (E3) component